MKILLIITTILFFGIGINAQDVEIAGKAKITVMDPATASAQQVAREPDGTLSLRSSGTTTYTIGDFAQGGVVFWVSASGEHGKVVSIYDVTSVKWSNITSTSIGSSARSDINGAGNTVAIMMQSGHTNSAARHCADLAYGGYDDWYLPSIDELNELSTNRAAINTTALSNGGEAFATSVSYWSSTEFSSGAVSIVVLSDGTQGLLGKNSDLIARAVRAF